LGMFLFGKFFCKTLPKSLPNNLNRREQAWDMGDKNQSVFPPNKNNLKLWQTDYPPVFLYSLE